MSLQRRRIGSLESLEQRQLMAGDTLGALAPTVDLEVMLPVKLSNVPEGALVANYDTDDRPVAETYSFGVEREMKERGEKGGTADINIGVGELQECTISKSMDAASLDAMSTDRALVELNYPISPIFIKSWSTSGVADDRPTEEVAFYYNKIAANYAQTVDGVQW